MTISWFRYVRHADVPEYAANGWTYAADLGPTHGLWSVLMQWSRTGSPPGVETDHLDAAAADTESSCRRDGQCFGEGVACGASEERCDPADGEEVERQHRDDLHAPACGRTD